MKETKLIVLSFVAILLLSAIACGGGGEQEVTFAVRATRVVGRHECPEAASGKPSSRGRPPRPKDG